MTKRNGFLRTTNARAGNRRSEILFSARVKAFRHEGSVTNDFLVDIETGEVLVYDQVARHYTANHAIGAYTIRRLVFTANLLAERL